MCIAYIYSAKNVEIKILSTSKLSFKFASIIDILRPFVKKIISNKVS